jgi:hypothetical protein
MELLLARVHPPDGAGGSFQRLVLEKCLRAIGDSTRATLYTQASPKLGPPSAPLGRSRGAGAQAGQRFQPVVDVVSPGALGDYMGNASLGQWMCQCFHRPGPETGRNSSFLPAYERACEGHLSPERVWLPRVPHPQFAFIRRLVLPRRLEMGKSSRCCSRQRGSLVGGGSWTARHHPLSSCL